MVLQSGAKQPHEDVFNLLPKFQIIENLHESITRNDCHKEDLQFLATAGPRCPVHVTYFTLKILCGLDPCSKSHLFQKFQASQLGPSIALFVVPKKGFQGGTSSVATSLQLNDRSSTHATSQAHGCHAKPSTSERIWGNFHGDFMGK